MRIPVKQLNPSGAQDLLKQDYNRGIVPDNKTYSVSLEHIGLQSVIQGHCTCSGRFTVKVTNGLLVSERWMLSIHQWMITMRGHRSC